MARIVPPTGLVLLLLIAGGLAVRALLGAPEAGEPASLPEAFAAEGVRLVPVPLGKVEALLEADRLLFFEARDAAGAEAGALFVAYYANRRRLAEPHAPEVCYRANGWRVRALRIPRLPHVAAFVAEKGSERRVVAYWYETRGGLVPDAWRLKLDLVRGSLARRPADAALVRLSAPVREGVPEERALEALLALAASIRPPLHPLLVDSRRNDEKP